MALSNGFVGAPVKGGIYAAPIGTALPTDATAALPEGFKALGCLSDEGYSLTRDRSTDDIRRWGGQIHRTVQTEFSETLKFTFIDADNAEVIKAVYGEDNVTTSGGKTTIKHNGDPLTPCVFAFEMKDGKKHRRFVVPNAQITETEDVTYSHSELVSYGVTVTAYPDEDGNCAFEHQDIES